MKSIAKRILSLLLIFTLTATMLPLPTLALDTLQYTVQTQLGPGLTLTQGNGYTESGKLRQLFSLDYDPNNENVRPIVLYGNYLNGKSTIGTVISYGESLGYRVLAAVNADFFFTTSGVPTGMTIQNGRLVSSDGAWNAVGFFDDGSAIAGTPKLSITLTQENGNVKSIYALNNVRTASGIYLYTSDFDATTATTAEGTEVVLELLNEDALYLGQPLYARVISNAHTTKTALSQGQMVLSLTDSCTSGDTLSDLQVGEEVTLLAQTEDSAWEQVRWSSGGGNMLVRNGELTADATSEIAPRTVLGVREDGSFRILECDGRQASLSTGISLKEAAQMLLEDGCTQVINLDGGGSSILAAAYPGKAASVLSSPSEGSPRACATYILFVTEPEFFGGNDKLFGSVVYPRSATLLAGTSMEVSAIGYNEDFSIFTDVTDNLTADGGWVSNGVYYAPYQSGTYTVYTSRPDSQAAEYTVVSTVASMKLYSGGKELSSLTLNPGETADLDVWAGDGVRRITCTDDQFTFTVTGDIGTVDENGLFTAGLLSGSGSITVSYGMTSCTIPVTVTAKPAQLLEDFENTTMSLYGNAQGSIVTETLPENIRYGSGSMKLTYTGNADQLAEYLFPEAISLSGVSHLSVMAKGSGEWYFLFAPTEESASLIAQPFTLSNHGWETVSMEVPADASSLLGFARRGEGSGTVWLDQLCAHFGSVERDSTPPVIALQAEDNVLKGSISDDSGDLSAAQITVTVDGANAAFQYSGTALTCALPTDSARHRVTVTAQDNLGNISRKSLDIGDAAASTFSDMNGHWASAAVEYLREKGVFSDAKTFHPGDQVTNAMAATMLSRYLGVDVSLYENTALPYTDVSDIPAWALPHVKAMYALGMMKGSVDSKGRSVLNPNGSCTRAQIMTMLGRTLSRGYAYGSCTFADTETIPAWSKDHVELLSALGIVTGNDKNQVNPTGTITRAEFAALLYRMF